MRCTDAGHARQVVGRITAKRCEEGVVPRRDTRALDDPRLVVQDIVGHTTTVVEDSYIRVGYELVGVPIAGDDDDVVLLAAEFGRERPEDVVGLVTLGVENGYPERGAELPDELDLLTKRRRHRVAAALVVINELVSKRRPGEVEGEGNAIGLEILDQLRRHRHEAVHRLGLLAGRGLHA